MSDPEKGEFIGLPSICRIYLMANFDNCNKDLYAISSPYGSEDEMTDEEFEQYYKTIEESEGFDVPYFPNSYAFGRIQPLRYLDPWKEDINRAGDLAIKQYNEQNDTSFEIIEYVKVNTSIVAGVLYYLTFEAKPSGTPPDHPTTTFQARVFDGIKDVEVHLCRLSLSEK